MRFFLPSDPCNVWISRRISSVGKVASCVRIVRAVDVWPNTWGNRIDGGGVSIFVTGRRANNRDDSVNHRGTEGVYVYTGQG